MRFATVCSGIEAASVAWKPLGWEPVWFSEIDPHACAALDYRYPAVPNLGDMRGLVSNNRVKDGSIDLLAGGTPCQSFSVAGLRGGLADARGNLALVFLQIARRARPRWLVWENVPGVLSSGGGRDFGAFLGGLAELGYGFAYRVLDAQYFGLAQRRQRVFVVGYLGDWRPAGEVLFEKACLLGNPPPSRTPGQTVASTVTPNSARSGGATAGNNPGLINSVLTEETSRCLTSRNARNARNARNSAEDTYVAHCLTASGDASPDGHGQGFPIVPVSIAENQRGEIRLSDVSPALGGLGGKMGQGYQAVQLGMRVRKLTPREWERLQGFPDDYTLVPFGRKGEPMKDGPRYKLIGNSWATHVARWIGDRIARVA